MACANCVCCSDTTKSRLCVFLLILAWLAPECINGDVQLENPYSLKIQFFIDIVNDIICVRDICKTIVQALVVVILPVIPEPFVIVLCYLCHALLDR